MKSKLIFIVETDDAYHYFTAIDNLSGSLVVHNLQFYTYDDDFLGEDEIIKTLAEEHGMEILNVIHI